MSEKLLTVSSSPHIRGKQTTRSIMTDVLIALLPAMVLSAVFFGYYAIVLIAICTATCILAELLTQKIMKQDVTIKDMSAAVTGVLLALNLPINAPWWIAVIGSAFAIVIVKQLFGGLGHNFINPALAARALLVASWPTLMTGSAYLPADAISSATPLGIIKEGLIGTSGTYLPSTMQLFLGGPNVYGCIGEVSALALILGGLYLIFRKVITYHIPVFYIGTVAVFTLIQTLAVGSTFTGSVLTDVLSYLFAGGLMLGAFFMATDYVTCPATAKGQIIYAIGMGIIICVIRFYGGYPEGCCYSILLMNVATPLIDKLVKAKKYGEVKVKKNA
ncbi:MAG: RnfABCDGE type electron transport complex subunit D [Anaerofustis sp.]